MMAKDVPLRLQTAATTFGTHGKIFYQYHERVFEYRLRILEADNSYFSGRSMQCLLDVCNDVINVFQSD